MNPRPLQAGRKCFLKHTAQTVQAVVTHLESRLDIRTFESEEAPRELALNDLGEIRVRTSRPLISTGTAPTASPVPCPHRAGYEHDRRRWHAPTAHRISEAGLHRLRDLTPARKP